MRSLPGARWLLPVSLLAICLVAPTTVGAPLVPDVVTGSGAASHFQVLGFGFAIEGGLTDWADLCADCLIRITITDGVFTVADSEGVGRVLSPGLYEIREFAGLFTINHQGPHAFIVQLHGGGKVLRLG